MAGRAKRVQLQDLAAATKASVAAVLGKDAIRAIKPPIIMGIVLPDKQLEALAQTPLEVAKGIARGVGETSGIRVTATTQKLPGGMLVGFLPPRLMK